jgi:DNA-directed RNA polymerase subunit D
MEIKTLHENKDSIKLLIEGASLAFINALRRTIIAEVPTMAIENVMILENSSLIYDEILAHRLGLIPLTTDLDSYVLPEKCSCKSELGCSKCSVSLMLNVEAADEPLTVYSKDLQPQDPNVKPVSDKIPILKLAPGQKVKLEAYAKLGKGSEHAKWQPVSVCVHKYYPSVTIDEKKCDSCGECIKFCPRNVFKLIDRKLIVENELDCTLCLECVKHCPKKSSPIKVTWVKDKFIFYLESTGALPPRRIIKEAIKIINEKTDEFLKIISQMEENA